MIYSKYGTDIKEMEEARYLAKRNMESLGNNIRRIRKQLGLTQEELALHVGVTPQAVSRWENGTGMPDISLVVPLAKTLRVSTDALFGVNDGRSLESLQLNTVPMQFALQMIRNGMREHTLHLHGFTFTMEIMPTRKSILTNFQP